MLKRAIFENWDSGSFLHVYSAGLNRIDLKEGPLGHQGERRTYAAADNAVDRACFDFAPDVILYRPVADRLCLHDVAMRVISSIGKPFALWMMDDWPERLRVCDPIGFARIDEDLKRLFRYSYANFAISDRMGEMFGRRYAAEFDVVRNGVRLSDWPARSGEERAAGPIRLRYSGNLAADMTRQSVLETAQAVATLREKGVDIVFEGRTQAHWKKDADRLFHGLPGVSFSAADMPLEDYRQWLADADISLIAYNFDEETRRYVQYSFANKTPEILASGSAVLAYGPRDFETIDHLVKNDVAYAVSEQGVEQVTDALTALTGDPALRRELGRRGREHAGRMFNLDLERTKMRERLSQISDVWRPQISAMPQNTKPSFDAVAFVCEALGAHHDQKDAIVIGCDGQRFATKGWRVRSPVMSDAPMAPSALSDEIQSVNAVMLGDVAGAAQILDRLDEAGASPSSILVAANGRTGDNGDARRELAARLRSMGYSVLINEHRSRRDSGAGSWKQITRFPREVEDWSHGGIIAFLREPQRAQLEHAFSQALRYTPVAAEGAGAQESRVDLAGASPAGREQQSGTAPMNISGHFAARHPVVGEITAFIRWSLRSMARRIFGFSGLYLVAMAALGAGAWLQPALWWLWMGLSIAAVGGVTVFLAIGYGRHKQIENNNFLIAEISRLRRETNSLFKNEAAAATAKHEAIRRDIAALRENARMLHKELREELVLLQDELSGTRKSFEGDLDKVRNALQQAKENLRRERAEAAARTDEKLSELAARTSSAIEKFERDASHASVANASLVRPHARRLDDDKLHIFQKSWIKTFGLDLSKSQLAYMAHKICLAEDVAEGRLAAPVETMLLRLLASHSLKGEALEILEIGTLFGVGAACLFNLRAPIDRELSLSLLDPMEGYYGRSLRDPITGAPVCEQVLARNLAALGVPDERWRLIKRLSTDEEAVKLAGERCYDMVIIDGDHSVDGVARDFELYGPMVKPGGILVFDDYDTEDWPSIKPFVDEYVRPRAEWNWIGGEFRTGLFRRAAGSSAAEDA
jgi:glycosyltransferase involved in cell wall biosynthesis